MGEKQRGRLCRRGKKAMKKTKEMRGGCAKVADEFVIDSLISPYF